MPSLSELTDYQPEDSGVPIGPNGLRRVVINTPAPTAEPSIVERITNKLLGLNGEERYQLWPEKVIREGLAAAGDTMTGKIPQWQVDPVTGDVHTSPQMVEGAQAMSALAGSGGLAGTTDATLGATPFLRPALKYKDRLYKGKEGMAHHDVIPDALYPEFQKMAMSGEDISHYNFGFHNDKGQFLSREKALEYGINNGLIDPQAGKYGALTSTLLADSSKPGMAIEAAKNWRIKGFEDYNDWYHGTTHNFDKFTLNKGNPENYLGKNPHFTNSPKDASANYAGMGPDLTNRIESLAENIAQKIADKKYGGEMGDNYGKIMTQAKELAKEKLVGEHEGAVIPANMKLENPISTVERRPTWLDFTPKMDRHGDFVGESKLALKLNNALEKQAKKYDFDPKQVMADLGEHLYEEVSGHTFDKALRNSEALTYAEDKRTGKLVSSDIIANIYKDMGFDGIVMDAKAAFPHMKDIPDGTLHAAPLKRNTVQSKLTGQVLYADNQPAAALQSAKNAPQFYSALEHNVGKIAQDKMNGEAWLGTLANKPGVKPEELQWSGLKDYLEQKKGKPVTKAQIEQHLAENKTELGEVVKGHKYNTEGWTVKENNSSWGIYDKDGKFIGSESKSIPKKQAIEAVADLMKGGSKYSQYQVPGGENYREVLMTLPMDTGKDLKVIKNENGLFNIVNKNGEVQKLGTSGGNFGSENTALNVLKAERGVGENYKSSHWDEPNILAHMRMNDRTIDGKKSLHLEEVQSDWHQEGRKKGYNSPEFRKAQEEYKALDTESYAAFSKDKNRLAEIETKMAELQDKYGPYLMSGGSKVPDAPFKKNWHELALKRAIREAAENGYDRLSWTAGEHHPTNPKNLKQTGPEADAADKGMQGFYNNIVPKSVEKLTGQKVHKTELPGGFKGEIYEKEGGAFIGNSRNIEDFNKAKKEGKFIKLDQPAKTFYYIDLPQSVKDTALQKGYPLYSSTHVFTPIAGNPFQDQK